MGENKAITIEDIAAKLGIAKSTVSKALSNATDINSQTRERILSCASEMGYISKRVSQKKRKLIVFVNNFDKDTIRQFDYEIITGFRSAASEEGIGVDIVSMGRAEVEAGEYGDNYMQDSYTGCLFLGIKPSVQFEEKIRRLNLPVIVFDNYVNLPTVTRIGSDNQVGLNIAVEHLQSFEHRLIAYLGGEQNLSITMEREEAFIEAMTAHNLRVYRKLVAYGSFFEPFDQSKVAGLVDNGATAIICASDRIAVKAIKMLHNLGLRVPQDVSVIGFDDLPIAKTSNPALTTISQNRLLIGKSAFMMIMQILNGMRATRLVLRPELVVRESTAKHIIAP